MATDREMGIRLVTFSEREGWVPIDCVTSEDAIDRGRPRAWLIPPGPGVIKRSWGVLSLDIPAELKVCSAQKFTSEEGAREAARKLVAEAATFIAKKSGLLSWPIL